MLLPPISLPPEWRSGECNVISVVSVCLFTSRVVGERAIGIRLKYLLVTARKRSLGQGNVFIRVCHSVHKVGLCMMSIPVWLYWMLTDIFISQILFRLNLLDVLYDFKVQCGMVKPVYLICLRLIRIKSW